MNSTSTCPHCNATLYGTMISRCSHCGNPVDVRKRTEQASYDKREAQRAKKEKGIFYWLWMNVRYASFKRACHANRGHLVETSVSGKSSEVVGGQLGAKMFNHMHLEIGKVTDGPAAWENFWKPRMYDLSLLGILECSACRHAYAVMVQRFMLSTTPLSDSYLASFKTGWFQIFSDQFRPSHGKYWLICPNCKQRTPSN